MLLRDLQRLNNVKAKEIDDKAMRSLVIQSEKYLPLKLREQYIENIFIKAVEQNNTAKVLLALSLLPKLQKQQFELEEDLLGEKVRQVVVERTQKRSLIRKREVQKKEANNAVIQKKKNRVAVPFSFFLLKKGFTELLSELLSSDEKSSLLTPPYQRITQVENGERMVKIIYHSNHKGEAHIAEDAEEELAKINQPLSEFYDAHPFLKLTAESLPNFVVGLPIYECTTQLRNFYEIDKSVQEFAKKVLRDRDIDLVKANPSIIPPVPVHKHKLDGIVSNVDLMGGVEWDNLMKSREAYTAKNLSQLEQGSSNYETTVQNLMTDHRTASSANRGGMK